MYQYVLSMINDNEPYLKINKEDIQQLKNCEILSELIDFCMLFANMTILLKGKIDIVINSRGEIFTVVIPGSKKRCGGQGDILAGLVGINHYFANKYSTKCSIE